MVECPECQGTGEVPVPLKPYWDRNIGAWVPDEDVRTCYLCGGLQEVMPALAEAYATAGGPPEYEDRDVLIYDTFLDQEERLTEAA